VGDAEFHSGKPPVAGEGEGDTFRGIIGFSSQSTSDRQSICFCLSGKYSVIGQKNHLPFELSMANSQLVSQFSGTIAPGFTSLCGVLGKFIART
jgi:hypothetical protein